MIKYNKRKYMEPKNNEWMWDAAWSTTIEEKCPKEGTLVWISDLHVPYHNKKAIDLALTVIQDIQPFAVYVGGDVFDFYQISDFDREPIRATDTLQKEFDAGRYIFKELCNNTDNVLYFIGNHEYRMSKLIIRTAPGLYGLRSLNLTQAAELPQEVKIVPYLAQVKCGKVNYTHGEIVNKSGNGVAFSMSKKYPGINLIQGHSHNADIHNQVFGNGHRTYAVSGTLCDFKKARYVNNPNWTTSFIVVDYWTTNSGQQCFDIQHAKILNNTVMVHGKIYK
jgi:predicted phosphodiesterase